VTRVGEEERRVGEISDKKVNIGERKIWRSERKESGKIGEVTKEEGRKAISNVDLLK
jgi:hypothetical protein